MPLLNGKHTLQVNLVVVPFVCVECLPLPVGHVVGLELETVTHVRALFWGAVADAGTWLAPRRLFDALEHVCEGCHRLRPTYGRALYVVYEKCEEYVLVLR